MDIEWDRKMAEARIKHYKDMVEKYRLQAEKLIGDPITIDTFNLKIPDHYPEPPEIPDIPDKPKGKSDKMEDKADGTLHLYRVTLAGMTTKTSGVAWGNPYVVAASPNQAVRKVQEYLVDRDLGFESERVLRSVELLADEAEYPKTGYQLFV
jgi:hypothetical protein